MSLDMRHSDIECALRGKNSAESIIAVSVANAAAQIEQPSIRPSVRATATNEPTIARIRKVGPNTAPGLIGV